MTYVDELDFLPEILYTKSMGERGLHAAYFNNKNLSGKPVLNVRRIRSTILGRRAQG